MTKSIKSMLVGLFVALTVIPGARAVPILVDDFNDGSTAGWTTRNGTVSEGGGFMTGTNLSLATMDGQMGSSIGVDAIAGPNPSYVALVLNYSSLIDNLFIKIQDNFLNDGLFDTVFFYHGNNDSTDGVLLLQRGQHAAGPAQPPSGNHRFRLRPRQSERPLLRRLDVHRRSA